MSKAGSGRVENTGYDNSGMTVIYVHGTSQEIADTRFSIRISSGEYAFYSVDVAKQLKGKTVLFNYLSLSDTRTPHRITFKAVVE